MNNLYLGLLALLGFLIYILIKITRTKVDGRCERCGRIIPRDAEYCKECWNDEML